MGSSIGRNADIVLARRSLDSSKPLPPGWIGQATASLRMDEPSMAGHQ